MSTCHTRRKSSIEKSTKSLKDKRSNKDFKHQVYLNESLIGGSIIGGICPTIGYILGNENVISRQHNGMLHLRNVNFVM